MDSVDKKAKRDSDNNSKLESLGTEVSGLRHEYLSDQVTKREERARSHNEPRPPLSFWFSRDTSHAIPLPVYFAHLKNRGIISQNTEYTVWEKEWTSDPANKDLWFSVK